MSNQLARIQELLLNSAATVERRAAYIEQPAQAVKDRMDAGFDSPEAKTQSAFYIQGLHGALSMGRQVCEVATSLGSLVDKIEMMDGIIHEKGDISEPFTAHAMTLLSGAATALEEAAKMLAESAMMVARLSAATQMVQDKE